MTKILIELLLCHLVGDYVLQSNYIATTKDTNWYHLFIHCALYTLPFIILFGFNYNIIVLLFITHILIDVSKSRYKLINYPIDQILHYFILIIIYRYILH